MAEPYTTASPVTVTTLDGTLLRTEAAHKARHQPQTRVEQAPTTSPWPTTAWETIACTNCGHLIHPGQTLWTTPTSSLCKDCHKT